MDRQRIEFVGVDDLQQPVELRQGTFQLFERDQVFVEAAHHFIDIHNFYEAVGIDDHIGQKVGDDEAFLAFLLEIHDIAVPV